MTRREFEKMLEESFSCRGEHPWHTDPDNTVFRHEKNRKWFALTMRIHRSRLGLSGDGYIDVVNLKCDREMVDSLGLFL
jgi:predicted DNA-binding protein (MmcQ/YjbR family)